MDEQPTVVGRIFLAADQQLWMEERSVGSGTDLVNWRGIEINKDASWNMLAASSLGEERLIGSSIDCHIGIWAAIRKETMLEEVQLPSRVS